MNLDNDPYAIYLADMLHCPNCRRQQLGAGGQVVAIGVSDCSNYLEGSRKQKYMHWRNNEEKRSAARIKSAAWAR